jgi:maltose O-acetyltransferase
MSKSHRWQQFCRHLLNLQFSWLPVFKFYNLKIRWLASAGITAGKDAKVNGHTQFYGDGRIDIGHDTWIGPGCRFYSNDIAPVSIGNNCDIAPEVAFVTGSHELGGQARRAGSGTAREIVVGDGCWIGTRATILGGVHIGKSSVIAAGALVSEDIPENSLAGGIPAKVIKKLPEDE